MVCILREFNLTHRGTIDYNFLCFHEAIHKIFAVRLSKKYAALNNHIYDVDDDVEYDEQNKNNNSQSDDADEGDDEDGDSESLDRSGSQLEKYLSYIRSGAVMED